MKIIHCFLLFLPYLSLCQSPTLNAKTISIGKIETIHSSILNETRDIWVYVPSSATVGNQNRYPVLYLLDGPSFFTSVTGIVQYLNIAGKVPEMIIVGIANTNRVRDLTPTHSISWSDGEKDSSALGQSGGGEKFISFIQGELLPYIDSVYKPAPYRMFAGHSLGGLTVINSLLNHTSLFDSYVAIDPSLWWDNQLIIKNAMLTLKDKKFTGKRLYFASANTMLKGMDTSRVEQDTAIGNAHVRENLFFRNILQKSTLQWDWKFYPDDNHVSVPLIACYDALRAIFKTYELGKNLDDTSITVQYIKTHYQNVSALLNYTVLPSQNIVNFLGYNFLANKNYEKAYGFFKMNIENYPSSSNAYDSMGDYYLETNEKKKAIDSFKKALSLGEKKETREKLDRLLNNN